jgi:hypothetical protein
VVIAFDEATRRRTSGSELTVTDGQGAPLARAVLPLDDSESVVMSDVMADAVAGLRLAARLEVDPATFRLENRGQVLRARVGLVRRGGTVSSDHPRGPVSRRGGQG